LFYKSLNATSVPQLQKGIQNALRQSKIQGETMEIQQKIKEELLKEVFTNIDNIYDFLDSRFKLDEVANETLVKKLNELKDVVYNTSQFCELS
jgi:methyl coenzyme M reductase beta subunit